MSSLPIRPPRRAPKTRPTPRTMAIPPARPNGTPKEPRPTLSLATAPQAPPRLPPTTKDKKQAGSNIRSAPAAAHVITIRGEEECLPSLKIIALLNKKPANTPATTPIPIARITAFAISSNDQGNGRAAFGASVLTAVLAVTVWLRERILLHRERAYAGHLPFAFASILASRSVGTVSSRWRNTN